MLSQQLGRSDARRQERNIVSSVRSWRGYPVKALHSKAVRQAPPLTAQLGQ